MSMNVDLSTPLSGEERAYLLERGRYAEVERADAMHGVEGSSLPVGDGTGPLAVATNLNSIQEQRIAELEKQLALLRGGQPPVVPVPVEETEELEPYETWDVKDLDAELKARKLPLTGNKQAKADALYADDEAKS